MITKQELIDFEKEVERRFNNAEIAAPCHLSGGNEDQLIEVFSRVKPHDYVFSTWRSHYHALLHGVPREQLMAKVLKGESISINVPERRFYSSAICGGCLPIALGVAWANKREWEKDATAQHDYRKPTHVWCFVGDMASRMGAFTEASVYAENFGLPITFVVEDNGKCVNADTAELWGHPRGGIPPKLEPIYVKGRTVMHYSYQLGWPHMGTGIRVEFDDEQEFQGNGGM